jgi:hypothetical protein
MLANVYWTFLIVVCLFAWQAGGRSERVCASIYFLGSVATVLASSPVPVRFQASEWGVLAVDLAVLAALIVLTLRSPRLWPIWATGFHVVGVTTHLAVFADPGILPRAYAHAQSFWAYPMMAALVVGTITYRGQLRAARRKGPSIAANAN